MNNKFTKGGMAHLKPYSKKKKQNTLENKAPIIRRDLYKATNDFRMRMQVEQELHIERMMRATMGDFATFNNQATGKGMTLQHQLDIQSKNPCNEIVLEQPEIKIEPHIEKIHNPKGYRYDRGFAGNHKHVQYKYHSGEKFGDVGTVAISDSVGGCGMQQLYAWTDISSQEIADKLVTELMKDLHYDTGLIICQVGQTYYEHVFVKALEKVGFTYPIEYKNFTHDAHGKYSQRVYTYQVPDKVPENIGEPKPWQY